MDDPNLSQVRDERPDIATTVDTLLNGEEAPLSAALFYGLSGLNDTELAAVEAVWPDLSPEYRRKIVRRLVDVSEANFELEYRALGWLLLADPDAEVREAAIELLFFDNSIALMDRLIELAQWDEATAVRAAAANALGRFILAGELKDLPESETIRAQDLAVSLWTNEAEDIDVRRRALEAISNSGHEIVPEAIEEAYHSYEQRLRVSALFAMGRSCDERWADAVLHELASDDDELRYEAARAAGELELRQAIAPLVNLAQSSDREISEVAIWSLGEIGGTDVSRALHVIGNRAEEAGDGVLLEWIEEALMVASLSDTLDMDGDTWDD